MATDFNYENRTINAGGPIKPSGKDMPGDPRTRVNTFADIASVPVPYVGMPITVIQDETNDGKMTDYIVKSLKANSLGSPNSLVDQVQRYVDYLGVNGQGVDTNNFATKEELGLKADKTELHSHINKTVLDGITSTNVDNWNNKVDKVEGKTLTTNDYTNEEKQTVASLKATVGDTSSGLVKDVEDLKTNGVSQDNINAAIENYLTEHPVQSGATTEQAAQIEANKTAIGDANSGLTKEINDVKNVELQNLNTAIQTLETLVGVDETLGDKSGLPSGDANVIASINRIDSKPSGAVTDEQISTAVSEYFVKNPIGDGTYATRDVLQDEIFVLASGTTVYGNIVLSTNSLELNENNSATFTIKLDSEPTNNQTVNISVNNGYCTLSKNSLVFTPSNYNTEQTITVSGVHFSSDYNDKNSNITCSSTGVTNKIIGVTIKNIDTPTGDTVSVTNVSLDYSTHTFRVGETLQLTENVVPENATNKSVVWSTNNSNCSVVNGLVTAISTGTCIVTCTTVDGDYTATCEFTIEASQTSGDTGKNLICEFDSNDYTDNTTTWNAKTGGLVATLSSGVNKDEEGLIFTGSESYSIDITSLNLTKNDSITFLFETTTDGDANYRLLAGIYYNDTDETRFVLIEDRKHSKAEKVTFNSTYPLISYTDSYLHHKTVFNLSQETTPSPKFMYANSGALLNSNSGTTMQESYQKEDILKCITNSKGTYLYKGKIKSIKIYKGSFTIEELNNLLTL